MEPIQNAVCCFTGHRHLPSEQLVRLSELMDRVIGSMVRQGVCHFRAGGALGFDMLAALKILDLKKSHPELRLHLYLPCQNQEIKWPERERQIYRGILQRADEALILRESYVRGCMHERNRRMVDGSDFCIAFCRKPTGGTAYTVRYAEEQGVSVINLADYLL